MEGIQRAPALPNSDLIDQLADAVVSKLSKRVNQHLLYTQGVVGSSPSSPTTRARPGHVLPPL